MRVLINLLPITSGGGLQVCLTFIKGVSEASKVDIFFVLVKDENEIADWLRAQDTLQYRIVPNNNFIRLKFEMFDLNKLIVANQIDVLYTFFGTLFVKPSVKLVMGCAYSNLFYPEIDFWRVGILKKQIKKTIDRFRLNSFRKADLVIFENEGLAEKASSFFGFKNVKVLLPSIAISTEPISQQGFEQVTSITESQFNVIMLSGWHVNKNIDKLLDVAKYLKRNGEINIKFNLSLNSGDPNVAVFIKKIEGEGLIDYFNFLDRVSPTDVRYLVEKSDAVLLISTLESFSNNIIEAWAYNKPLIITDAEWSRGACHDAAYYVDIDDAEAIAQSLITVAGSQKIRSKLVALGDKRLKDFPTPQEKVDQHIAMLREVFTSC